MVGNVDWYDGYRAMDGSRSPVRGSACFSWGYLVIWLALLGGQFSIVPSEPLLGAILMRC